MRLAEYLGRRNDMDIIAHGSLSVPMPLKRFVAHAERLPVGIIFVVNKSENFYESVSENLAWVDFFRDKSEGYVLVTLRQGNWIDVNTLYEIHEDDIPEGVI